MSTPEQKAAPEGQAAAKEESFLDRVLAETPAADRPRVEKAVDVLIRESLKGTVTWDKNVSRTIQQGIAAIDAALSKQLAAIMHAPDFQKLEGTRRGCRHLA